ncbi:MAG: hypothetical protein D6748_03030 [Calditrichaeota bacterium]|nr:MAG: hypothetical protein D6748_03030 [Calditrichota bacterium]
MSKLLLTILGMVFWGYFQFSLGQEVTGAVKEGNLRFFYNRKPDSLWINGNSVDIENGEMITLPIGMVKIKALKECYHPIVTTTEVIPQRIIPVKLKFRHFTTDEYTLYRYYQLSNIVLLPVSLAGSLKSKKAENIFPFVLAGTMTQVFWNLIQRRHFDRCSRAYHMVSPSENGIWFGISMTSFYNEWGNIQYSEGVRYFRDVPPPVEDFYIDIRREVTTSTFPDFDWEGYAFNLEFLKNIHRNLTLYGGVVWFPRMTIDLEVQEFFLYGNALLREYNLTKSASLFLFNLELQVKPIHILNQEFYGIFGGFWGKSIQLKKELLFDPVTPVSATNQDTVRVNAQLHASGYTLGIGLHSPLTSYIGLFLEFRIQPSFTFTIGTHEQKRYLRSFRMGMRYYL